LGYLTIKINNMETLDEKLKDLIMSINGLRSLYETLKPIDINNKNAEELQNEYDEIYDMIQLDIEKANEILSNTGKTLIPNLIKK
jgi:hypothetical protein